MSVESDSFSHRASEESVIEVALDYRDLLTKEHLKKPNMKELFFAGGDKQFVRRELEVDVETIQGEKMGVNIVSLEPVNDNAAVKVNLGEKSFILHSDFQVRNHNLTREGVLALSQLYFGVVDAINNAENKYKFDEKQLDKQLTF